MSRTKGTGEIQRKVLLFIYGGLALSLSRSPVKQFRIVKTMQKELQNIRRDALYRAIRSLYQSRLVSSVDGSDGITTLILTEKGKEKVLRYRLNEVVIKNPDKWDGKWRLILFDIPESRKKARDAIRMHIKRLGLLELQKSVFVYPYPCDNELEFLIEFYQLRPCIRLVLAEKIDTELHLKKRFGLK